METLNFRPCGDCVACCEGHLSGTAYGNPFGNGRKCIFLVKKECQIYNERPEVCRKYQCVWSQGIFPEWMKPNKTGIMISAEWKDGKQYLRVIEISREIDYNAYEEIKNFCIQNDTYFVKVPYESRYTEL